MLHVKIISFSYRNGWPPEHPEHGGGFAFDCRCLPNPGREKAFHAKSGLDSDVIEFLTPIPEVEAFFQSSLQLCLQAIENYVQRGFGELLISFGCTGGQHRSVYMAERLANELRSHPNVDITLVHREKIQWRRS